MTNSMRRRAFFQRAALAGMAATTAGGIGSRVLGADSPNETLNIGVVGTANRGAANIQGVESQNIVALCDIDDDLLGRTSERFPRAKMSVLVIEATWAKITHRS